jgi:hypothetical protein
MIEFIKSLFDPALRRKRRNTKTLRKLGKKTIGAYSHYLKDSVVVKYSDNMEDYIRGNDEYNQCFGGWSVKIGNVKMESYSPVLTFVTCFKIDNTEIARWTWDSGQDNIRWVYYSDDIAEMIIDSVNKIFAEIDKQVMDRELLKAEKELAGINEAKDIAEKYKKMQNSS